MLTAADFQFEPPRQKIIALTNSIFLMTAGDASFLTRVLTPLVGRVQAGVEERPDAWLGVGDVTRWYVDEFNRQKALDAQTAVLGPFGLTTEAFLNRQATLDSDFVFRITLSLIDHPAPDCSVVIAGRDPTGTHIYSVDGTEVDQHDTIGFTAVGIGARHALSHLMQVRNAWNSQLNDTVVRAFVAKRRSETAPGVGRATDMVVVGEALGQHVIVGANVLEHLDQEYEKMVAAERAAEQAAREAISAYVNGVQVNAPEQQQADVAAQEER